MTYNLTNVTAANNIIDLVVATNNATDLWMMRLFLYGTMLLIFMALVASKGTKMGGIVAASFIGLIISSLMAAMGLLGELDIFITLALAGVSIVVLYLGGADD